MRFVFAFAALFTYGSYARAQVDERPTYDAVVRGMACKQSSISPAQLDCDYRVGNALHFVIAGVGQEDAAITVVRSAGYDADYYASYGLMHGCMIVKPGRRAPRATDGGLIPDMAFVSPTTGKVYTTWDECGRTTKSAAH